MGVILHPDFSSRLGKREPPQDLAEICDFHLLNQKQRSFVGDNKAAQVILYHLQNHSFHEYSLNTLDCFIRYNFGTRYSYCNIDDIITKTAKIGFVDIYRPEPEGKRLMVKLKPDFYRGQKAGDELYCLLEPYINDFLECSLRTLF